MLQMAKPNSSKKRCGTTTAPKISPISTCCRHSVSKVLTNPATASSESLGSSSQAFLQEKWLESDFFCSGNSGIEIETQYMRKRKIVEHIFLLKANEDLSDEEEKDMLDYLCTAQYLMGGIVAISLGLSLYRLISLLMVKLWIRTKDNEITSNILPLQEGGHNRQTCRDPPPRG